MSTVNMWEKLKDFSTVAAGIAFVLYATGYIIHTVHYFRVLGLDLSLQPLEYIKTAGDYCSSIFISIPQIFIHYSEILGAIRRETLLICAALFFVLFLFACIGLIILRNWRGNWLRFLPGVFLLIAAIFVIWQEFNFLQANRVLQTFEEGKVKEVKENVASNSSESTSIQSDGKVIAKELALIRKNRLKDIYFNYAEINNNKNKPADLWINWFNPMGEASQKQSRLSLYLTLLFLNLVMVIFGLIYIRFLKSRLSPEGQNRLTYITICTYLILLLFHSIAYAVIGRSYDYPVVTLTFSSEDSKESPKTNAEKQELKGTPNSSKYETHPVFLVIQTDTQVIVYDRLDFFKVKYIPRSRINGVNQILVASPFENCGSHPSEFIPCEIALEEDNLWVKDY